MYGLNPQNSTVMGPKRNWTEEEGAILLRQVSADTPFLAKYRSVMEAWNKVATTISCVGGFSRPNFDGKKAQNRFIALLEKHNDDDKVSARASGVSEPYKEKQQFLDSLASLVSDHKLEEAARAEEEKKKKEDDVVAGARAREAAMQVLGKRTGGDAGRATPEKKSRIAAMIAALAEETGREMDIKQQELELRRLELEERRIEREEASASAKRNEKSGFVSRKSRKTRPWRSSTRFCKVRHTRSNTRRNSSCITYLGKVIA